MQVVRGFESHRLRQPGRDRQFLAFGVASSLLNRIEGLSFNLQIIVAEYDGL